MTADTLPRYTVVQSARWQRDDGMTASIYGAVPWLCDAEAARWQRVVTGWTVRDNRNGTIGAYAIPFGATREQAQDFADRWNNR